MSPELAAAPREGEHASVRLRRPARDATIPRLLIVDDDEGARRTLAMVLEKKGFDVQVADSATQSVQRVAARAVDLALVDVRLPDGLGTEVISALQRMTPDLVVIMMTAYASVDDAINALNKGASAYLTKPLNLDEVVAVIRESLSKQSLTRENARLVAVLERELAERTSAEVELERLRAVIESTTTDFVGMSTPAGDVLYINRHGRKMLGIAETSDLAGLTVNDLHPPDSLALLQNVAQPAAAQAGAWTGEITFKGRAGSDNILTSMTLLSHKRPGGEVERFSTISRDITAQRSLERQLMQAQRMEAVGRVAGGVAHDFNNCLQIILGYAADIRGQLRPADPLYEVAGSVLDAGERAAKLTAQLLAFTRRQTQRLTPVDINRVVTGLEGMLQRMIGEDIELRTRKGPSLGLVMADESQLEQVLLNLIVNARDAMPRGGLLTIETSNVVQDGFSIDGTSVPEPGNYVLVTVSDTGCGMDEETLSHMFEPFYSTKSSERSTGLGLSTVYGIVKQNGGFIGVNSQLGAGTTLRFFFPRVEVPVVVRPTATAVSGGPRTETILIAEDEPMIREFTTKVLLRQGFRVLEAADGAEALRVSEQFPDAIDLLLTDVIMPNVGGREFAERLQVARPGIRVLYVSGYTDDSMLRCGALQPGVAFLAKPFRAANLISAVCAVLDKVLTATPV